MLRNLAGTSSADVQSHDPPPNVASKVAEVFLTAGHAFQRLGDLTLQLHSAEDTEESKWSEGDVEQLRDALTKFAHELDTISERVQTRTMQIIKTDIKRRVVVSDTVSRSVIGPGATLNPLKRPAGTPMHMPPTLQPKRLIPVTKPTFAPASRMGMPTTSYTAGPMRTSTAYTARPMAGPSQLSQGQYRAQSIRTMGAGTAAASMEPSHQYYSTPTQGQLHM